MIKINSSVVVIAGNNAGSLGQVRTISEEGVILVEVYNFDEYEGCGDLQFTLEKFGEHHLRLIDDIDMDIALAVSDKIVYDSIVGDDRFVVFRESDTERDICIQDGVVTVSLAVAKRIKHELVDICDELGASLYFE